MTDFFLNSFQKIAARYGCTAPTSATGKIVAWRLPVRRIRAQPRSFCLRKMLNKSELPDSLSNVSRHACKLWLCTLCFALVYRENNVLSDVFKNAPQNCGSQWLAWSLLRKCFFLDVGRCRSKNICFYLKNCPQHVSEHVCVFQPRLSFLENSQFQPYLCCLKCAPSLRHSSRGSLVRRA